MSLYDLTGNKVSFTYGRLVQIASGSYYDGFGNPLNLSGSGTILTTGSTYPITSSWSNNTISASYASTSSYAVTASYALNSLSASYCINPFPISGSLGYWGSFWDTTTQTNASSSNVMRLNNTDPDSNGVSIESGSRIKFAHDGVYNLQFSAVFITNNASSNDVDVWFSKNGQTLTDSNTVLTVGGQSNAVAAWNYVLKLYSNDYIELYWHSLESTMKIAYLPTQSIVIPATPSLIVTATQVTNTQIAPSASYALTASYALNAGGTTLITGSTYPITSSWANNVVSASYALSSSYALSASYSPGGASLSGGTTNYIPLWTSTTTLSTSSIYQSGNSIGIGTTSPSVKVDVVGDVQANAFYGKSFNLTTTSGQSAIFDTFTSTGTGEVYEVTIKGNPNAGESGNYQDVIYGKIIVGTGKTGSIATTFINYVQESPDPRLLYSSGGTSLTASVYFNSASINTTQKGIGESTPIRIVVGSYAVGYVGNNTIVRLKQIL